MPLCIFFSFNKSTTQSAYPLEIQEALFCITLGNHKINCIICMSTVYTYKNKKLKHHIMKRAVTVV